MSELDPLYCFVDANILIHFQTFDEVDWASRFERRHVRLVLAPAVMSEIDKFKDDTKERRRKRVRMVLAKLRELLNRSGEAEFASISDCTTLAVIDVEPQMDWRQYRLDPTILDDRLIASILEFRQEHGQIDIVLLTDDFPLQRKARRHGILCRDPEGMLARHELLSSEEETIRKQQRELAELRSHSPKLELGFLEAGALTQHIQRPLGSMTPNRPTDDQIARRIACIHRQLHQEALSGPNDYFRRKHVKDFEEEYAHYLVNVDVLLKKRRAREFDWRYELAFELGNSGTTPAEDVDVTIDFPSGSFVVALEDENDEYDGFGQLHVWRPIPDWKRTRHVVIMPTLPRQEPWSITYPEHHEREAVPTGPQYNDDRSRISYQHPKLRPQERWQLPAVAAYIPPGAEGGFGIRYVIRADQLAKPIKGQLHVRFEARS